MNKIKIKLNFVQNTFCLSIHNMFIYFLSKFNFDIITKQKNKRNNDNVTYFEPESSHEYISYPLFQLSLL